MPVSEYLMKSPHREKIAVLLTPVCAEMRGYDRSRQISVVANAGSIPDYLPVRLSCIHRKCPFTAKMDISIGTGKGGERRFNETVTFSALLLFFLISSSRFPAFARCSCVTSRMDGLSGRNARHQPSGPVMSTSGIYSPESRPLVSCFPRH